MDELAAWEDEYKTLENATEKLALLNKMLARLPLLHGYWLKLLQLSSDPAADWQRALGACPVLDLYAAYLKSPHGSSAAAALQAVDRLGYHYQSFPLWSAALERTQNDKDLILRALRAPLYAYAQIFQLAYDNKTETPERLATLSEGTASRVTARWQFESKLKRPYFHPFAVDEAELVVWDAYLDYIEQNAGSPDEVQQLYERCLVTTALYPRFWIRYLAWLASHDRDADHHYESALHYHPDDRILRLLFSRSLELMGRCSEAREQLLGLAKELASFDWRTKSEPGAGADDPSYVLEYAKLSGSLSHLPAELALSPELFESSIHPRELLNLWQNGKCPDPARYAQRLREAGCLDLYFQVDATLGYTESI